MKILVAVKRVVDAKVKVRPLPDRSGPDTKLARMAINPFDEIAVEEALNSKKPEKSKKSLRLRSAALSQLMCFARQWRLGRIVLFMSQPMK